MDINNAITLVSQTLMTGSNRDEILEQLFHVFAQPHLLMTSLRLGLLEGQQGRWDHILADNSRQEEICQGHITQLRSGFRDYLSWLVQWYLDCGFVSLGSVSEEHSNDQDANNGIQNIDEMASDKTQNEERDDHPNNPSKAYNPFMTTAAYSTVGRCFCITKNRHIGIVPPTTISGDKVMMIEGSNVHFIVRHVPGEACEEPQMESIQAPRTYRLVGPANIHIPQTEGENPATMAEKIMIV
ncbi:hypothetical protein F5Y16DRAFT_419213 [Xylariaceae sp. FL0255]|nr:hypothetical protein F5Y16DRAFT_419213 [Xylariaceae sp. FL0255]